MAVTVLVPGYGDADRLAIATDRYHRRRVVGYLRGLSPDLLARLVDPVYNWQQGWWMDAGGVIYGAALPLVRASVRLTGSRN